MYGLGQLAAAKQSELHAIGCEICQDPRGLWLYGICPGCNLCAAAALCPILALFLVVIGIEETEDHTTPQVDSHETDYNRCSLFRGYRLAEFCDPQSPLVYAIGDPYLNKFILAYVLLKFLKCVSEEFSCLLGRCAARVRKAAGPFKQHPSIDGCLLVCKGIRGQGHHLPTCRILVGYHCRCP